jgi:hypothetical protein
MPKLSTIFKTESLLQDTFFACKRSTLAYQKQEFAQAETQGNKALDSFKKAIALNTEEANPPCLKAALNIIDLLDKADNAEQDQLKLHMCNLALSHIENQPNETKPEVADLKINLLLKRGQINFDLGDNTAACYDNNAVLEIDPENSLAHTNIAILSGELDTDSISYSSEEDKFASISSWQELHNNREKGEPNSEKC